MKKHLSARHRRSPVSPGNPEWLAQLRAEHKAAMTQGREEVRAAAKAQAEAKKEAARVKREAKRTDKAALPKPSLTEAQLARQRDQRNRYMIKYRRTKNAADPVYQRARKTRNQRRWARRARKKLIHDRWVARMEQARLRREAREMRRRMREEREAQRAAQELADKESKRKYSPWQKRLAEAKIASLQEGIRVGCAQVLAELEAQRAADEGNRCMRSSERI